MKLMFIFYCDPWVHSLLNILDRIPLPSETHGSLCLSPSQGVWHRENRKPFHVTTRILSALGEEEAGLGIWYLNPKCNSS